LDLSSFERAEDMILRWIEEGAEKWALWDLQMSTAQKEVLWLDPSSFLYRTWFCDVWRRERRIARVQGPVGIDMRDARERKNDTSQRKRKAIRRLEHMTLARHSKNQNIVSYK
jgi:hypothetical protein